MTFENDCNNDVVLFFADLGGYIFIAVSLLLFGGGGWGVLIALASTRIRK